MLLESTTVTKYRRTQLMFLEHAAAIVDWSGRDSCIGWAITDSNRFAARLAFKAFVSISGAPLSDTGMPPWIKKQQLLPHLTPKFAALSS